MATEDQSTATCGQRAHACVCIKQPDHRMEPHLCKCGGSWFGRLGFNTFEVVTWPPGVFMGDEEEE